MWGGEGGAAHAAPFRVHVTRGLRRAACGALPEASAPKEPGLVPPGHPKLGPPGVKCPIDASAYAATPELARLIVPCTNFDPDHRRCFRHPVDDVKVEEEVDSILDIFVSNIRLPSWPRFRPVVWNNV